MIENTLLLLHIIFRHGERTPDRELMYPNDPYLNEDFLPYGPGQLTDIGKMTMYELGKILRKRYNDFVGDHFVSEYVDACTTNVERTKTSLKLVLASLFPLKEDSLWWDSLILGACMDSKEFLNIYQDNYKNEKGQAILQKYNELMTFLTNCTGEDFKFTRQAWLLLATLITEVEFGLTLPKWTASVFPHQIKELASMEYGMQTATKNLKRLVFGEFVQKILTNTIAKVNGNSKHKLHLYSGHDFNIAHTLIFLKLMYPHFPSYGACEIIEIHKTHEKYGIKVLYRENKMKEFVYLTFPHGTNTLDLDDFQNMVQDLFNVSVVDL